MLQFVSIEVQVMYSLGIFSWQGAVAQVTFPSPPSLEDVAFAVYENENYQLSFNCKIYLGNVTCQSAFTWLSGLAKVNIDLAPSCVFNVEGFQS